MGCPMMGAENLTWVLCKSICAFNHGAISSAPLGFLETIALVSVPLESLRRADEMNQLVKVLVAKPGSLSSIPGTHMVRGTSLLTGIHASQCTYTHNT